MINEIVKILTFMAEAYVHAWPYLLVTIPLAVMVNLSGISRYIGKAFNAKPLLAIFLATVVGAFSPFCSCGVIPVITALLISGVPLAPVMSFWLASPSMDPEVFFLSVSQLGMDLAVWRLAGTFIMSLSGGYITHFLIRIKWIDTDVMKLKKSKSPKRRGRSPFTPIPVFAGSTETCCPDSEKKNNVQFFSTLSGDAERASCSGTSCGSSCDDTEEREHAGDRGLWSRVFEESRKALFMIFKFMSLAFFLEALIILYLPEEWIVSLLGRDNIFAIPLSTLIGIPLYTTNLTALGLTGGLLNQGMNPGAVLAFLIGGATTTVPAMAAVYGIVKKRVFILYVSFALCAALLTGYLYHIFNTLF